MLDVSKFDWTILWVACFISKVKSDTVVIPSVVKLLLIISLHLPITTALLLPKPNDWLAHPRLQELCLHRQRGHEGKTIKGFKLAQVFIVHTPGLRFDQGEQDLDTLSSKTACWFESFSRGHPSSKLQEYTELLQYKYLLKQGDQKARSAFQIFSPVPNHRLCRSGMLTSLGAAQSIWLGEYFSLAYHELWSLHKDMAIARTIGEEVLYQTASAVLYGLLHEKQFVKNHVQKMKINYGLGGDNINLNLNIPGDQNGLSHHFVQSAFEKEHHIFKDTLSPTVNRDKLKGIVDSADISAKHILNFSALKFCPVERPLRRSNSAEEAASSNSFSLSHVLSVSDGHNDYLSKDSFFQSYAKSRTHLLRKFMQAWVKSPKSIHNPEINLVAVDNLFFLSLLTSLNKSERLHIPPVSRLVFEKFAFNSSLHEKPVEHSGRTVDASVHLKNQNCHEFFRVLLNGKVVTKELGRCSSDPMVSLGLCSASSILAALSGGGGSGPGGRDEL